LGKIQTRNIMKTIDIGNVKQNEETLFRIEIKNELEFAYNIRKIEPFCSCIKIVSYTEKGVFPVGKECENDNTFVINFKLKKRTLGVSSTKIELILESPFTDEAFEYVVIKYNVVKELKNENIVS